MPKSIHDWIPTHKQYFLKTSMPLGSAVLKKGQVVTFVYNGEQHWVLIVDPKWEGKVHALNLKYVPRRVLLRILNEALPTLTERQFYSQHIDKPWVRELQAYRTYDRAKISSFQEITYNLTLQGGEKDEPGTDEPLPGTPSGQTAQGVTVAKDGKVQLHG